MSLYLFLFRILFLFFSSSFFFFFWCTANIKLICTKGQESELYYVKWLGSHPHIRVKWVPQHNMGDESKSSVYLFNMVVLSNNLKPLPWFNLPSPYAQDAHPIRVICGLSFSSQSTHYFTCQHA